MFSGELLPIYLNDHLAAAVAGCELAKRAAGANEGTELGDFLADLAADAEADRAQLEDIMARLDVGRDQLKVGAGWLAEKLGRLKLNGRLFDYSPLSRVLEMEALIAGVTAKIALWRTLAATAASDARIADVDFVDLVKRGAEQLDALSEHHGGAVEAMLATR